MPFFILKRGITTLSFWANPICIGLHFNISGIRLLKKGFYLMVGLAETINILCHIPHIITLFQSFQAKYQAIVNTLCGLAFLYNHIQNKNLIKKRHHIKLLKLGSCPVIRF